MTLRRRWTAVCDAEGCDAIQALLGDQYDGEAELGMHLNDSGWWATPARGDTFCEIHYRLGVRAE